MTWMVWRQHRKQLLFAVAALVVFGAFFVGTGRPMHHRFDRAGLPGCLPAAREALVVVDLGAQPETPGPAPTLPEGIDKPPEPTTPALVAAAVADARCVQEARAFYGDYQSVPFVGLLLLVLPMLAGMFWGAPLVARGLEAGTHRLVWAQGTSRLRWATTKFGLVTLAVLVITAIYAAMLTWWIMPVIDTSGQRFDYIFFDIHGIVVFGYVVFALALGVFASAVTGRLSPALPATVVGFIGVRLLVMLAARDRYMPTETRRTPNLDTTYPTMRNDLNGDWIRATGAGFEGNRGYEVLTIHPIRQFWAFQTIETAIFVALALSLFIGAIYWTRRRIT